MICICEQCIFANECEYYEEVVKPVLDIVNEALGYDLFIGRLKDVLEAYECEYFKGEGDKSDV